MTIVDLSEIELSISSEHHHGHAARVLANSPGLEEEVRQVLTGTVGIARTTRRAQAVQREGLTAASLNQGIKEAFTRVGGWSFEAVVREGVVFDWTSPDSKKEGFDIARYDLAANVARAWSLCFGRRALADGAQEWARFQTRRPDLADLASLVSESGTPGTDLTPRSSESMIFGEVQFGNWGLAYRDLLRLVDADSQAKVDLYVYITGAESLNRYLSKGIVTYASMVQILGQFTRLIRVPVWVIGLGASDL